MMIMKNQRVTAIDPFVERGDANKYFIVLLLNLTRH